MEGMFACAYMEEEELEERLPDGWSKCWSTTWQKHYWFNAKTGQQVWERPSGESAAGCAGGKVLKSDKPVAAPTAKSRKTVISKPTTSAQPTPFDPSAARLLSDESQLTLAEQTRCSTNSQSSKVFADSVLAALLAIKMACDDDRITVQEKGQLKQQLSAGKGYAPSLLEKMSAQEERVLLYEFTARNQYQRALLNRACCSKEAELSELDKPNKPA
jgi:hypothetical protein